MASFHAEGVLLASSEGEWAGEMSVGKNQWMTGRGGEGLGREEERGGKGILRRGRENYGAENKVKKIFKMNTREDYGRGGRVQKQTDVMGG